ncbi:MAG TPA: NAD(P)-dependent oxidoreductase [Candidatus Krumholzibacteria bacterium]|nr:NAD(P)-dependent oxidoreductase [Candidatus Krumholzibacteria bacterium]HPD71900.1 NAD(P)-dependent oxidoreductase [Candidatus Krumholzibacteria bacterium]HRY41167.1 NAD(P)-dependent oxidoreductase [Candidatus Krumholzibacteria bacterium]
MARWLVTGGSGFLGVNLARFLVARGHAVTTLDKEPFDYPDLQGRITHAQIDVRDRAGIESCLAAGGFDVVMHGAAALPLYSKRDILTTNIDGTRNVLEAAFTNRVPRSIYISSTAVYGLPDKHPLFETDATTGVGPYGISKVECEHYVRTLRERGLTVTTIRPKSFVGPERLGVFAIFYEWASEGRSFPMIGRGRNLYQLLDVEDLCEALVRVAEHPDPAAVNTEFNIGAKVFSTMREDYQAVLDRAGFGRKIRSSPGNLVVFALEVLELLHLSPLYPWVYKTATRDSFVSVEKAERALGFTPRFSNQDALLRNYEWYLANRERFQHARGDRTHRVPWSQGVLGLARHFF